jgi:hypothetical protein
VTKSITFKVQLDDDVRRTLNAFSRLQRETNDRNVNSALRQATKAITQELATEIKRAAYVTPYSPAQAVKVAQTVKVLSDRVPKIGIGKGRARVFSGGARPGQVLFGSEFGAIPNGVGNAGMKNGGRRFPPKSPRRNRGNAGYWIFPTIRANERMIRDEWFKMTTQLLKTFSKD